jgi:hypothetical protein
MAARIDFYAVVATVRLAGADDDDFASAGEEGSSLDPVGFVSAADTDEELLFALFSDVAGRSDLNAVTEGAGVVPAEQVGAVAAVLATATAAQLDKVAPGAAEHELAQNWITAAARAALAALSAGTPLAWRTRYDRGGTTDDGPLEFTTAW